MVDKFYFQGKFFDNEDEFWEYVNQWPHLMSDSETIDRLMNSLKKQVQMNIGMYNIQIPNGQMNIIIEQAFLMMMKEIMKYTQVFKSDASI